MEEYLGRHGAAATHIRKLFSSAGYRRENREYVCEGTKLLEDAARSGVEILRVVHTDEAPIPPVDRGKTYLCDGALMESLSSQKSPQGVIFTCRMGRQEQEIPTGFWLILDGVQDPGNVGTVLRSAEAFGAGCVILTPGCADPYLYKTVRASMGSVFRQRFAVMSREAILTLKRERNIPLYCADMGGESPVTALRGADCAVVVGSEGRGPSQTLLDAADGIISIPMAGQCESLNAAVAASVILWEHMRNDGK